jgi:hypothetical protein
MTVPPGFEVKLSAAEPMITQPMAFCWDDRGRLWVAENRDYETRRAGFAASGDSRIVILEDHRRRRQMDTRKVFSTASPSLPPSPSASTASGSAPARTSSSCPTAIATTAPTPGSRCASPAGASRTATKRSTA